VADPTFLPWVGQVEMEAVLFGVMQAQGYGDEFIARCGGIARDGWGGWRLR
jgi:hypothetical protein